MANPGPKQTTAIDHGIGSRIALLRTANGLSQSQLASAVGVSFQQVQKYESGKNRVGASRLRMIAERLGVPVSSFFEDAHHPAPSAHADLPLHDRDAVALLRAYASIPDEQVRRDVLAMVKTTVRIAQAGAADADSETAGGARRPLC